MQTSNPGADRGPVGGVTLVAAESRTPASTLVFKFHTEPCNPLAPEADGWELADSNGCPVLVDTRRPKEVLTQRDLP